MHPLTPLPYRTPVPHYTPDIHLLSGLYKSYNRNAGILNLRQLHLVKIYSGGATVDLEPSQRRPLLDPDIDQVILFPGYYYLSTLYERKLNCL